MSVLGTVTFSEIVFTGTGHQAGFALRELATLNRLLTITVLQRPLVTNTMAMMNALAGCVDLSWCRNTNLLSNSRPSIKGPLRAD